MRSSVIVTIVLVALFAHTCVGVLTAAQVRAHTAAHSARNPLTPLTRGSMPIMLAPNVLGNNKGENCTTCDNKESCCGGEECCSGGAFCCANTAACCNDTCCDRNTQACCPDPKNGGVCCTSEDTFCCPPSPPEMPSRCCPRWYVCCSGGQFGCCDPGTMLPMEEFEARMQGAARLQYLARMSGPSHRAVRGSKKKVQINARASSPGAAPATAYSLMTVATLKGTVPFMAMTLDVATGKRTNEVQVSGFDDWGETVRRFTLDRKRNIFYLPQANFTGPAGNDQNRKIHIYAVDPVKGDTTVTEVTGGATGLVTGFVYDATKDTLLMATILYDSQGQNAGYKFFDVNPDTGNATLVSSQPKGSSETWAGYFRSIAYVNNKRLLYRMGFLDVNNQVNPGIGITDISTSTAATFTIPTPPPKGYQAMQTISIASASGTDFVSMAPGDGLLNTDIALFKWSISVDPTGTNATATAFTKLASLGNAHPTPKFGPLGYDVDPTFTTFGALVVHDSIDTNYDLWALSEVELSSGTQQTKVMDPWLLAGLASVSGFGYPASSSQDEPARK